ncbi:hypothetical protein [Bacillus sp. 1P06AnD]|uniref:hypothetical protein n=1 Tax=Bacillus sp. 1P06AnD TaxID=3132208 RepID=UPI0039A37B54
MKKNHSLINRLQGYFNANKSEFLKVLKEKGKYLECCQEKGFLYAITIDAYQLQYRVTVGLKNGLVRIHSLKCLAEDNLIEFQESFR